MWQKLFSVIFTVGILAACNKTSSPSTRSPSAQSPTAGRLAQPNSLLTSPAIDQNPVYLAMGGWNSCSDDPRIPGQSNPYGMNMNKEFSVFLQHIESRTPGVKAKFIMSCHTANTNEVRFVSSSEPAILRIQTHENLYKIAADFAKSNNVPLIIMGHSYGGDFAMRAVQAMPPDVRIPHLLTIDPISHTACPPLVMTKLLATRFTQIIGTGGDSSFGLGCQQSPRDYSGQEKLAIRQRVGWWENYYQSDLLSILKADAIPEACNQPIKHTTLKGLINGHIAMGMYDSLWNDILDRVTNTIPSTCVAKNI